MDNNLGGADGDGTRFVVVLQIVFSQIDSVGAASARSKKRTKYIKRNGGQWIRVDTFCFITVFFFFLLFALLRVVPDAVSSSEDPLAGDQSATAGVVKVGAALVLQRNLKMAKDTLILNEY